MFESEAAALASRGLDRADEIGPVVDIGGGTPGFSVFRTNGGVVQVRASHGTRVSAAPTSIMPYR